MWNQFYDYLTSNIWVAIAFIAILVIIAIVIIVKEVQRRGMEAVRGYVYQLFVEAEHGFAHGENKEKFEYVVKMAKAAIPLPFCLLISETLIRKVVQAWFDLVKDLLDDGKLNRSEKKGV